MTPGKHEVMSSDIFCCHMVGCGELLLQPVGRGKGAVTYPIMNRKNSFPQQRITQHKRSIVLRLR